MPKTPEKKFTYEKPSKPWPITIDPSSDDMPVSDREINGKIMKQGGTGLVTALLRGKPGAGKTRFYLKDLMRATKDAYKKLYNENINWKDYKNWNDEKRKKVVEASKHCMMCVIDMDYQGLDDLVDRDSIVPPEIAGSIFSMGVTGLEHKDGIKFYDALIVRNHLLRKLEWHSKKYPENRAQRFMVLDNTGTLYRDTIDKYFYDTTAGEVRSMREKMERDEAENYRKFNEKKEAPKWKVQGNDKEGRVKKSALFQSGQRDTFRVIDSNYKSFFSDIVALRPDIGFNLYVTAHIVEYTKENEETGVKEKKNFTDGRADGLLAGFFNLVLTFNKEQHYVRNSSEKIVGVEIDGYYVDTAMSAKNRLSPDFIMDIHGKGTEEFYNELQKMRDAEEAEFLNGGK